MSHDPLCPFAQWSDESCYQTDAGVSICSVIARVREDERAKVPTVCTPCWYQDHDCEWPDKCRCGVCADMRSRAAALRDAVEAVKALPDTGGWTTPDGVIHEVDRVKAVAAIEALGVRK